MKKRLEEPKESALTQNMDVGTQGFDNFQSVYKLGVWFRMFEIKACVVS